MSRFLFSFLMSNPGETHYTAIRDLGVLQDRIDRSTRYDEYNDSPFVSVSLWTATRTLDQPIVKVAVEVVTKNNYFREQDSETGAKVARIKANETMVMGNGYNLSRMV